jgi:hypothetical protein
MANQVFNRSLGRIVEFAERVNANDPVNSVFTIRVLAAAGVETDAVLKDKDTFADVVSGATNEVTNSGYAAKTLDNATGGITITYDDTNDRVDVDVPDRRRGRRRLERRRLQLRLGLDGRHHGQRGPDDAPRLRHHPGRLGHHRPGPGARLLQGVLS